VAFGGQRRGLARKALLILAVGDQQQRLVAVAEALHPAEGLANRVADGRATARRRCRSDILERGLVVAVIRRERARQNRLARERDEPDAIPADAVEQIANVGLRAFEPAGFHVLTQHGARDVQQHHDVRAAFAHLLEVHAPSGPRRRENQKREPREHQRRGDEAAARRPQRKQTRGHRVVEKSPRRLGASLQRETQQTRERQQQPEREQEFRMIPTHQGRLRNRVARRINSRSSNSAPGSSTDAYSSRYSV